MLITIITFVIVLGLLVFVHELGHFLMAKRFGIRVEEFGFGFPPRIMGVKKGETTYTLNWIPLGGFVKIKGETGESHDPDSFSSKPVWQRSLVLSAGVLMNFIFAFVIYTIGFMVGLPQQIPDGQVGNNVKDIKIVISEVAPGSAAEQAGVLLGDQLLALDGNSLDGVKDVQNYLAEQAGQPIDFTLLRSNDEIKLTITATSLNEGETRVIGIGMLRSGIVRLNFFQAVVQGAVTTFAVIVNIILAFVILLKNLVTTGSAGADLAGPIGVAVLTGDVVRLGFVYVLNFMAILSVNLGIINILPFPALDGGRLLFVIIEKIKGSPVNQKLEIVMHNIGFLILLGLILLVTVKDVSRYGVKIWEGLTSIF